MRIMMGLLLLGATIRCARAQDCQLPAVQCGGQCCDTTSNCCCSGTCTPVLGNDCKLTCAPSQDKGSRSGPSTTKQRKKQTEQMLSSPTAGADETQPKVKKDAKVVYTPKPLRKSQRKKSARRFTIQHPELVDPPASADEGCQPVGYGCGSCCADGKEGALWINADCSRACDLCSGDACE
jgi:hypothetical protein